MEVLTRAKKWTFLKGVSPWILSKNGTFSYRRFLQKSYQKTSFLILWKKIEVLKRARKWTFFKGVSGRFCPKKHNFYYLCFSLKLCHKRFFFDIYEKKRMILSG